MTAGAIAACSEAAPTDISVEFKETPFRHLRGVEPGMTARQLRANRPAAKYAPYFGMQEQIPGYVVSYSFPAVMSDEKATSVGDNDKLEGVFVTEAFVSKDDADKSWYDKIREVSAAHRPPTACESFPAGGRQARWLAGKNALTIGVFPREPMAAAIGDRVIFAFAPAIAMNQPKGGTTISCPSS